MTPTFEINVKSHVQKSAPSALRPADTEKIESINRGNRRFNLMCQIITIVIITAMAASLLSMVLYGLNSLSAEVASWRLEDLQRAIVGY